MELMSSLLLCALAALVPLTLGILPPSEIKIDDHKLIGKTPVANLPKFILKPNPPFLLTQSKTDIWSEPKCKNCQDCMEMVLTLQPREHKHIAYGVPDMQEAYANDILESYHQYKLYRKKREFEKYQEKTVGTRSAVHKMRKNKAVTVTKYSSRGQVYALKIQEGDVDGEELENNSTACRVYRVKKNYPCDVTDNELIKLFAKKKKGKRTKKARSIKHKKNSSHTTRRRDTLFTPKPESSDPKGMKPLGDTSQMVENSMTSLEEMY